MSVPFQTIATPNHLGRAESLKMNRLFVERLMDLAGSWNVPAVYFWRCMAMNRAQVAAMRADFAAACHGAAPPLRLMGLMPASDATCRPCCG
jgi:hypothetical protein